MTTARSASGTRYVGGYTWWTKGPNADLYRGTDPASLDAALEPSADHPADDGVR